MSFLNKKFDEWKRKHERSKKEHEEAKRQKEFAERWDFHDDTVKEELVYIDAMMIFPKEGFTVEMTSSAVKMSFSVMRSFMVLLDPQR